MCSDSEDEGPELADDADGRRPELLDDADGRRAGYATHAALHVAFADPEAEAEAEAAAHAGAEAEDPEWLEWDLDWSEETDDDTEWDLDFAKPTQIRVRGGNVEGRVQSGGGGWNKLRTNAKFIDLLPVRDGCRLQHWPTEDRVRYQVWYPPASADEPASHCVTRPAGDESGLVQVCEWAWRRHMQWLESSSSGVAELFN